ncbi:MAG: hypothetical protein K6G80_08420 [Treponema sp.]|nr:hypothetical protein [Treponema sp.]
MAVLGMLYLLVASISCSSTRNVPVIEVVRTVYETEQPDVLLSVEAKWKYRVIGAGYESFELTFQNKSRQDVYIDWSRSAICCAAGMEWYRFFCPEMQKPADIPLQVDSWKPDMQTQIAIPLTLEDAERGKGSRMVPDTLLPANATQKISVRSEEQLRSYFYRRTGKTEYSWWLLKPPVTMKLYLKKGSRQEYVSAVIVR